MGETYMALSHAPLVTEKRSYGEALGRLLSEQKSTAGVPAYLRWVNRPLGRRFAALAYVAGLTPNQVTVLSGAASAIGIVVLIVFSPTVLVGVAVCVAMLLGYALDSADGQLARLTGSSGPSGEFLDHVVDAIRQPATHLAIAASLQFRSDLVPEWPALVAIVFASVTSVWFFGQILAASLLPRRTAPPGASAPAWVSFVKLPYDPGFLFLLLLLLPWAWTFVTCYVALFVFTLGVATLSLWRKYQASRPSSDGSYVTRHRQGTIVDVDGDNPSGAGSATHVDDRAERPPRGRGRCRRGHSPRTTRPGAPGLAGAVPALGTAGLVAARPVPVQRCGDGADHAVLPGVPGSRRWLAPGTLSYLALVAWMVTGVLVIEPGDEFGLLVKFIQCASVAVLIVYVVNAGPSYPRPHARRA